MINLNNIGVIFLDLNQLDISEISKMTLKEKMKNANVFYNLKDFEFELNLDENFREHDFETYYIEFINLEELK